MITEKIKSLFNFINFLHSNIENFKKYNEVMGELYLLQKERSKVRPRKNFADKLKYDEVQAEIKQKINVISENIIQVIQAKARELNICDLDKTETLWNWNISEIYNLKDNFSKDDIPEILLHKSKYIEFRTETNCTYFQDIFFSDLDEILKELFDFFKESTENEFETFETKTIQVNSIREAFEQLQKGQNKFTLPIDFLNPSKVQQSNNEALPPQQKEYDSLRRVYSFILAVAFHAGHSEIKNKSKTEFETYVAQIFPDVSKNTIYQTVRSTYKSEKNYINFLPEMKKDHFKDYAYAMKIITDYFPEIVVAECN